MNWFNFSSEARLNTYIFLVGSRYAMLSMKVTLATTLKKYRVTTDMKMSDIKLKFDFIVRSVNGYKVKLHTRS